MRRKTHNKSRVGCKNCKQKHVKCDENRPSCANCVAAKRVCSYLLLSVSKPSQPPPIASSTSPNTKTVRHDADPGPTAERYTITHIELVLHYEHDFIPAASMGSTFGQSFLHIALGQAVRTPYLMDQIVALSALHKSKASPLEPSQRASYHAESLKLQTRALSQFRDAQDHFSTKHVLPMFLFSSMLGQQLICEALRKRSDFSGTLEQLVQCFSLYRGARAIADHSWPTIQAHFEAEYGQPYPTPIHVDPDSTAHHTIYLANLQRFLRDQITNDEDRDAYLEIIETLQQKLDKQQVCAKDPFLRAEAVHEWVVHVPANYVGLLQQRRPEALIILAGFSVLLHNARDCWAFTDAGLRMIRGIEGCLGAYWSKWLEWPHEVLNQ